MENEKSSIANDDQIDVHNNDHNVWFSGATPDQAYHFAKSGDSNAQEFLGYCYHFGRETKKDLPLALYWYSEAIKQGNITAEQKLKVLQEELNKLV